MWLWLHKIPIVVFKNWIITMDMDILTKHIPEKWPFPLGEDQEKCPSQDPGKQFFCLLPQNERVLPFGQTKTPSQCRRWSWTRFWRMIKIIQGSKIFLSVWTWLTWYKNQEPWKHDPMRKLCNICKWLGILKIFLFENICNILSMLAQVNWFQTMIIAKFSPVQL